MYFVNFLLNINESKILSFLIIRRVEKEARRYKVQVPYVSPSTPIRDILYAPILLHTPIQIAVLMKRNACRECAITCCFLSIQHL
jgi:hypothetical protein